MAIAAAHHRLNFIHPFPDGNGRVSRLMSHAMGLSAGIGAHGLWSVSRGLARGLESRGEYKRMMDHADMPRQGDLDGRGNLSQRGLSDFVFWFLRVCLDQVMFMSSLFELDTLARRLRAYVARSEVLKPETARLLEEALIRGEFERGEAPRSPVCRNGRHGACSTMRSQQGYLRRKLPRVSSRFGFQLKH